MAHAEVTVSIESIVHAALEDLAQRVCDEYGVRILAANFDWVETTRLAESGRSFRCIESRVSSSFEYQGKGGQRCRP